MPTDHPIRISLDVSAGTFSRIKGICNDDFRDKASYLRMLLNEDFIKREKGKSDEKR